MGEANFQWALGKMKDGIPMKRSGWNGTWMSVVAQRPDENSKMNVPYLYMSVRPEGKPHFNTPWLPSQSDLFATDWMSA